MPFIIQQQVHLPISKHCHGGVPFNLGLLTTQHFILHACPQPQSVLTLDFASGILSLTKKKEILTSMPTV